MNQTNTDKFWAARLLEMPRMAKRLLALAVDGVMCVLTVWLALYLRLEQWVTPQPAYEVAAAVSILIGLPLFVRFGLYRAIFRHTGWNAMLSLLQAMAIYTLGYATVFSVIGVNGVPRTVGIIQPLLLMGGMGLTRVMARYWLGGMYRSALQRQSLSGVLVYGAGSAGRQLAAALSGEREYRLLGFLDDDTRLHHHSLDGRMVYSPGELEHLIPKLKVTDVLLAIPSVTHKRRLEILEILRHFPVHVRTMPSMADLASGRLRLNDIREHITDLLDREMVTPSRQLLHRNTFGKTVLVTGAGGSVGSELCRQIVKCRPKALLLVDMSEFALYRIHHELQAEQEAQGFAWGPELVPLLASACDPTRMQEIMHTWHPHTVYHSAAYKHVPLVEHNPAEGVRNNVWGTWICARAAALCGVESFVLISTDKAVRPTNIMGASKRLAEMVLQGLATADWEHLPGDQHLNPTRTCFSMVRFGNVLGSSGSVVPLFREQIRNGGPITITHPDITRYFMTIQEAAQLVIQAGAMATGGDVFVLDMGQPVRIYDLARRMVQLSGLTVRDEAHPHGNIEIQITGLRPGEKLYEELLIGDNPEPTQHPRILKAHEHCHSWEVLQDELHTLELALNRNDVPVIRNTLRQLVQGYEPANTVVDWVHLAHEREEMAKTWRVKPSPITMPPGQDPFPNSRRPLDT
ncbi:MAG: polysaccharide biosynthesis protein [Nitrospirota bacterium]|nr:polysaccharide biosynthesis protein [Nitrospirota bacterium]